FSLSLSLVLPTSIVCESHCLISSRTRTATGSAHNRFSAASPPVFRRSGRQPPPRRDNSLLSNSLLTNSLLSVLLLFTLSIALTLVPIVPPGSTHRDCRLASSQPTRLIFHC